MSHFVLYCCSKVYDSDADGVITEEDLRVKGIKLCSRTPSVELSQEHQQNQMQDGTQRQWNLSERQ